MYDVLAGIKVVEVATVAFVPSAGVVLAEWGADVVKIAHPRYPDTLRSDGPGGLPPRPELGVVFMWEVSNRGKREIGVDLKHAEGREILYDLVRDADVFLTNFLPEARKKLGIEVEDIRAMNPSIVYARGSGHGPRGPHAERAGYDHTSFWSRTGIAHVASSITGEFIPQIGPGFGDVMSGFTLAAGVAAALVRRERTGQGAVVDVSLLSTGMWMYQPAIIASRLHDVDTIPRFRHAEQRNPLLTAYETKDHRFLYITALRDWTSFVTVLGRPDLGADPRFADDASRQGNARACIAELDMVFAGRTLEEWKEAFDGFEGAWTVVQTAREVHDDPQVIANGYLRDVTAASGVRFAAVANPVQFDESPTELVASPPEAGHTEEILRALGRSDDDIARLRAAGTIV